MITTPPLTEKDIVEVCKVFNENPIETHVPYIKVETIQSQLQALLEEIDFEFECWSEHNEEEAKACESCKEQDVATEIIELIKSRFKAILPKDMLLEKKG